MTPPHHHDHNHDHVHGHDHAGDSAHNHVEAHGHAESQAALNARASSRSRSVVSERRQAQEAKQARRLVIICLVVASFFVVELLGARAARSDVLEADAFHLLMDVLALVISLGSLRLARAKPTERFTYGLRRVEPLAALINGLLVFGVAVDLVHDGLAHLAEPTMPRSGLMLAVASGALVVNAFSAWLLHGAMHSHGHDRAHEHGHNPKPAHASDHHHDHDHDHDQDHDHGSCATPHPDSVEGAFGEGPHVPVHGHHLSVRGAWLHLMGDAMGSCAAFGAGLAIRFGASPIVDPLASFVVVAILVVGAWRLVRDAARVLLDAAPAHVAVERVRSVVLRSQGVVAIHALHVWSLGTGHDAITLHVLADASAPSDLGPRLSDVLRARFHAEYVTVQVERSLAGPTTQSEHAPHSAVQDARVGSA